MTRGCKLDPRTKLIVVLCISTLGIVTKDINYLVVLLTLSILAAKLFKVDIMGSLKKVKRLLYMLAIIAIVQSIFSSGGEALLSIGSFTVLSTVGLEKALQFILRMMIIIFSATIITTSNSREIVQGFVQWGLPYDIAFMVVLGIRFLPLLTEEIKDSLTAIQLRGIEISNIPMKERISVYAYLFNPILVGAIIKAEKLSIAMEMRGFRAYDSRTSYLVLKMSKWDYLIIFISIIFTICYIFIYFNS
jgi:energy-coupling factor transport system permease protein